MKKWMTVVFGLGIVLIFVVAIFHTPLTSFAIDFWGRRVIYPTESTVTRYPGAGRVMQQVEATLLVIPKGVGRPAFVNPISKGQYSSELYDVVELPAQEQLMQVVGRFVRWENIAESQDKYMVVQDPKTGEKTKYRIGFVPSRLYNPEYDESTRLAVEQVHIGSDVVDLNKIENVTKPQLADIGYQVMKKVLRGGDTVILFPVFSPPKWAGVDEVGIETISSIIVRRIGGVETLNKTIENLGGKQ